VSDNVAGNNDDLDDLILEIDDVAEARAAFEDAQRRRQLASAARRERKRVKLSQQEVGRRMGTAQSAVSALEGGKSDPQLSTMQRWARAIGLRADVALVDPRMPVYDEQSSRVLWHMLERKSVRIILRALLTRQGDSEGIPIHDLAKLAEIPRSATQFIVDNLEDGGWIKSTLRGGMVAIRSGRVHVVGVHVKSGEIRLIVTDLGVLTTYYSEVVQTRTDSPRQVVNVIAAMVRRACDHSERSGVELLGVGVVLAGIVEPGTGNVIFAPDLKESWRSFPFQAMLQEKVGPRTTVVVENDANALAIREYLRSGDDHIIALLITTGIGSGILFSGRPVHGAESAGGELGHVVPEQPGEGRPCRCGRAGCLETLIGEPGLLRSISMATGETFSTLLAVDADHCEDARVLRVYKMAGHYLGVVLAPVVAGSNPKTILVFGPEQIADQERASGRSFIEGVGVGLSRQRFTKGDDAIKIRALGEDALSNAAAGAVVRDFMDRPWVLAPSVLVSL